MPVFKSICDELPISEQIFRRPEERKEAIVEGCA